jgi:hypothetical protein
VMLDLGPSSMSVFKISRSENLLSTLTGERCRIWESGERRALS